MKSASHCVTFGYTLGLYNFASILKRVTVSRYNAQIAVFYFNTMPKEHPQAPGSHAEYTPSDTPEGRHERSVKAAAHNPRLSHETR